ncbi:DUF397 domain-containing protein [Streptacidiphilus carbonis]|uniref:DUF397 domain-containing protein n=1 Tax=Streptacidiphilus carbonis TaxID=105422 RepID=UPI0005A70E5D|nr:DUF397 domain-containing protein [Streptacidiphilus carbonis]
MTQNSLSDNDNGLNWKKSTYSGNGNCVEVAKPPAAVAVRDSKDPSGPALSFTPDAWTAFIAGVNAGAFEQDR